MDPPRAGAPFRRAGAQFRRYRIAMAFAVAGLAATGPVEIDDPACVDISYPLLSRPWNSCLSGVCRLMTLRFLTSGESQDGDCSSSWKGLPRGLLSRLRIWRANSPSPPRLRPRPAHGAGARRVQVWGGLRNGRTTGAPVGLSLDNAEAALWEAALGPWHNDPRRPGRGASPPLAPGTPTCGGCEVRARGVPQRSRTCQRSTTAPAPSRGALARRLLAELDVDVAGLWTPSAGSWSASRR
jgi:hypothetical protein